MCIVTNLFVFTLLFEQFLNIPLTKDGFAFSLMILGVAFVAFIIKALINKDSDLFTIPFSSALHVLILTFFLVMIISLINSGDLKLSLLLIQRFMYCIMIYFFMLYTVKEKKQLTRVYITMLSAYFLISIIGIFEAYIGKSIYHFLNGKSLFGADLSKGVLKMSDMGRVHGPVGDPELHSGRMLSFFFFSLPLLLIFKSIPLKILAIFSVLLAVINILGTGFKGTIPALLVSLIVFFIPFKSKWKWEILVISVVLMILTGLLIHVTFPKLIVDRLFKTSGIYAERIQLRKNNLLLALKMGCDHPIIGTGPNGFVISYSKYSQDIPTARMKKIKAHNTYGQVFAEFGLFGVTIFLSIFIVTLIRFSSLISNLSGTQRYLAMGIMASICSHLVLMMGSNFLLDQNFWLLLALARIYVRIYSSPGIYRSESYASSLMVS